MARAVRPLSRRLRRCWAAAGAVATLLLVANATARAQVTCRPSPGSNEARLLAHYTVPIAFAATLPSPTLPRGGVSLALEGSWVPTPSRDVRRTDECYAPKDENTGLSPVLPRPRLAVGLGGGVTGELSYLPPVTVADATPSLLGVAISFALGDRTVEHVAPSARRSRRYLLRAHATVGYVDGPITCPRSALQDVPTQPCFGTSASNDRYAPNVSGVEGVVMQPLGARWRVLAGAGVSHARPRFRVNFRTGDGLLDRTRVEHDFTTMTALGGITARLSPRLELGVLAYEVIGRNATVRVTGQWRVR